jgi:hypothetical protein
VSDYDFLRPNIFASLSLIRLEELPTTRPVDANSRRLLGSGTAALPPPSGLIVKSKFAVDDCEPTSTFNELAIGVPNDKPAIVAQETVVSAEVVVKGVRLPIVHVKLSSDSARSSKTPVMLLPAKRLNDFGEPNEMLLPDGKGGALLSNQCLNFVPGVELDADNERLFPSVMV